MTTPSPGTQEDPIEWLLMGVLGGIALCVVWVLLFQAAVGFEMSFTPEAPHD